MPVTLYTDKYFTQQRGKKSLVALSVSVCSVTCAEGKVKVFFTECVCEFLSVAVWRSLICPPEMFIKK